MDEFSVWLICESAGEDGSGEDAAKEELAEKLATPVDVDALANKLGAVQEEREEAGEHWHPNDDEREQKKFKSKRKEHYNEFLVAKKLAEKLAKEEEEAEEAQ